MTATIKRLVRSAGRGCGVDCPVGTAVPDVGRPDGPCVCCSDRTPVVGRCAGGGVRGGAVSTGTRTCVYCSWRARDCNPPATGRRRRSRGRGRLRCRCVGPDPASTDDRGGPTRSCRQRSPSYDLEPEIVDVYTSFQYY